MAARDYDDEDRGEAEEATDMDPEKWLLRMEDEKQDEEEEEDARELLKRIDSILKEFPKEERKMFKMVFREGASITAAARECGVKGTPRAKFEKMLEMVRQKMGV